jgi:hypothetical protein
LLDHALSSGELLNQPVVNTIVRHHSRTVYSSQTLRHVAEQIDALLWTFGEHNLAIGGNDVVILRGHDLRDHE